jgi:hypothetical protein
LADAPNEKDSEFITSLQLMRQVAGKIGNADLRKNLAEKLVGHLDCDNVSDYASKCNALIVKTFSQDDYSLLDELSFEDQDKLFSHTYSTHKWIGMLRWVINQANTIMD